MKKLLIYLLLLLLSCSLFSQTTELTFPVFDGSYEYMTIKQSDDLFFSLYNISTKELFENHFEDYDFGNTFSERIKNIYKMTPWLSLMVFDSFIFGGITHEEAHRAILTNKGIGSVSQPIIKMINPFMGVAYVKGVRDNELKNLRDTDFLSFIRMHTAGLESDYLFCQKGFDDFVFNNTFSGDALMYNPSLLDYIMRGINMTMYQQSANSKGIKIAEETNELERDIVGDDVCGMIHHLFNPTAEYHRYFDPSSFSEEEKKFAKRIYWKAFLNFPIISPVIVSKNIFEITPKLNLSFNTGYCLTPFGDLIDENIYLQIKNVMQGPMNIVFTARQYQNKDYWFPEFDLRCEQFSPLKWLTLNAGANIWWQPENLSFTTDKAEFGGSVELGCNIYPFKTVENAKYEFGINLNCMYKTKGFKPEIMSMDEDFIFTAGISLRY